MTAKQYICAILSSAYGERVLKKSIFLWNFQNPSDPSPTYFKYIFLCILYNIFHHFLAIWGITYALFYHIVCVEVTELGKKMQFMVMKYLAC